MAFAKIATWQEVRGMADRGTYLWYQAPLDYSPVPVVARKLFKNGKIRISWAHGSFTADPGHLDRFRRRVEVA